VINAFSTKFRDPRLKFRNSRFENSRYKSARMLSAKIADEDSIFKIVERTDRTLNVTRVNARINHLVIFIINSSL